MTDDVTTVRRFFAAWSTGHLEALLAVVHPEVVVSPLVGVLYNNRDYRGRSGVAEAFAEIDERWDRFEMRVEEARRSGDRVIALIHVVATKHEMASHADLVVACTLRDGLIVSLAEYEERRRESPTP
jgi:ketosteroid isomerase-like protein